MLADRLGGQTDMQSMVVLVPGKAVGVAQNLNVLDLLRFRENAQSWQDCGFHPELRRLPAFLLCGIGSKPDPGRFR